MCSVLFVCVVSHKYNVLEMHYRIYIIKIYGKQMKKTKNSSAQFKIIQKPVNSEPENENIEKNPNGIRKKIIKTKPRIHK